MRTKMVGTRITATRYHDFSAGHRVAGHESKCANMHGHNYRVHFTVEPNADSGLDAQGRVIDFSVIKDRLCEWLEANWDHRFLAWEHDLEMKAIHRMVHQADEQRHVISMMNLSMVWLPFNPTAENMANYLLHIIGPERLEFTGTRLIGVEMWETRKCLAAAWIKEEIVFA